jgi:uncharacterized protein (TIGR04255 family)
LSETNAYSKWGELKEMTQTPLEYSNPPIAEAILELRVAAPQTPSLEQLANLLGEDDGYAPPDRAISFEGEFNLVDSEVVSDVKGSQVGHRFRRLDESRVVQVHVDRYAFSWLEGYRHWEDFLEEAELVWERFKAVVNPDVITYIGVRFINRIQLPARTIEIKDYVRTSVDLSPYLPQQVAGMFSQIDVPLPQHEASARITLFLEPTERPSPNIVLDIDVNKTVTLSVKDDRFSTLLDEELSNLRDAKNFVFEACITDATRGLIQ